MGVTPRYSIKGYLVGLVISATLGLILGAIILLLIGRIIGFGSETVLVIILCAFPFSVFALLYGFYKGLVRYYGLNGKEKMFFGGRF